MDWKSQAALFRLWTNLTKESPIVLIGPDTFPRVLKWKFWTQLTKEDDADDGRPAQRWGDRGMFNYLLCDDDDDDNWKSAEVAWSW